MGKYKECPSCNKRGIPDNPTGIVCKYCDFNIVFNENLLENQRVENKKAKVLGTDKTGLPKKEKLKNG